MLKNFEITWTELRDRIYDVFSENKILLICWGFCACLDAYSTTCFMEFTGASEEVHPLTTFTAIAFGVYIGPWVAGVLKLFIALPVLACWKKAVKPTLITSCMLQLFAFYHNMMYSYGLQIYHLNL
ncbi:MAG: hypothetical protein NE328_24050 [Lentisphaeraceae bacterium]|nr:hypothetical protein [Lentisphaeraceae bacterium]